MRKGNPHLDERELDRLGKIGDPFSTWRKKGIKAMVGKAMVGADAPRAFVAKKLKKKKK